MSRTILPQIFVSHSTRVRGLKYRWIFQTDWIRRVALYTSAWIEMRWHNRQKLSVLVALYTSAWIEIIWLIDTANVSTAVALYTSAWIEIVAEWQHAIYLYVALYTSAWIEIILTRCRNGLSAVALYTSAWIEIVWVGIFPLGRGCVALYTSAWIEIMPKWTSKRLINRRTLHECVDWNSNVRPFFSNTNGSHSTRVRGLKFYFI